MDDKKKGTNVIGKNYDSIDETINAVPSNGRVSSKSFSSDMAG